MTKFFEILFCGNFILLIRDILLLFILLIERRFFVLEKITVKDSYGFFTDYIYNK